MNVGYLMIKPDGHPYLKEFEYIILNEGLTIEEIYHIDDWKAVCSQVYRYELEKRSKQAYNEFLGHVWLDNYLFGNSGAVLILSKGDCSYEELIKLILSVKMQIRKSLSATKDGTFMIALDMTKIGLSADYFEGSLNVVDNDKQNLFSEFMHQKSQIRGFYLQYVHCPEPNIEDNERELEVLKKMNVLTEKNKISKQQWELMKKLKTCEKIIDIN